MGIIEFIRKIFQKRAKIFAKSKWNSKNFKNLQERSEKSRKSTNGKHMHINENRLHYDDWSGSDY